MTHIPAVESDERYAERYAIRRRIADDAERELAEAITACGPGADAYGRWTLHDKLGLEPARVYYCCTRPEFAGWQPPSPENDERIPLDSVVLTTLGGIKYEARSLTINGVTHYPYRWTSYFGAITEYTPHTPEQMKAAAERRRDAAMAKVEAEERAKREETERQPDLFGWAGVREDR